MISLALENTHKKRAISHLSQYRERTLFVMSVIAVMTLIYFVFPTVSAELVMEYLYFVISVMVVLIGKQNHGTIINLLSIYTFLVFYFNGLSLVWDVTGILDVHNSDWFFSMNTITHENNLRAIYNLNLSLLAFSLGDILYCSKKKNLSGSNYTERVLPDFVLYFLLSVGLVIKAFYAVQQFSLLQTVTYHETFGDGGVAIPSYAVILSMLSLYVILLKITLGKRINFWYSMLAVYILLSMAGGQRAKGLMLLMMIIYYLHRRGTIHLRMIHVGILGVIFLGISIFIANFRNGSTEMISEISEIVAYVQGIPYQVLQCAVQYRDQLDYNLWDMFGNIRSMLFSTGADSLKERAEIYKIWNGYISYVCNPEKYYVGFGMGGNFIGQLFAAGREFFVLIFSIWGGYFLCVIDRGIFGKGSIKRFLYMNVAFTFLYISRDHLFAFCNTMVTPLLCGLIVQIHFWLMDIFKIKMKVMRQTIP